MTRPSYHLFEFQVWRKRPRKPLPYVNTSEAARAHFPIRLHQKQPRICSGIHSHFHIPMNFNAQEKSSP